MIHRENLRDLAKHCAGIEQAAILLNDHREFVIPACQIGVAALEIDAAGFESHDVVVESLLQKRNSTRDFSAFRHHDIVTQLDVLPDRRANGIAKSGRLRIDCSQKRNINYEVRGKIYRSEWVR